jgi:2Fe-2S iron-sulfur cluster binding domain
VVRVTVNGVERAVQVEPDASLLVTLRGTLGLAGAKYGSGEGVCGACTRRCLAEQPDLAARSWQKPKQQPDQRGLPATFAPSSATSPAATRTSAPSTASRPPNLHLALRASASRGIGSLPSRRPVRGAARRR